MFYIEIAGNRKGAIDGYFFMRKIGIQDLLERQTTASKNGNGGSVRD